MDIYSFTGPSGTGKSTVALYFADTYKIDAIIDDGLLIINGQKRAGISAKFEKNTMTAVHRAIFSDDAHCESVKDAIAAAPIERIMLIGTSDKMTRKIAKRLELGDIQHFHYVNEFRSANEMDYARFVRLTEGQHVMPVPHAQVEQNFFKRLVKKGWDIISQRGKIGETTIVRPDFQHEVIAISQKVYEELIRYSFEACDIIAKVERVLSDTSSVPKFTVVVTVQFDGRTHIPSALQDVQQRASDAFFTHFTFRPANIHIVVRDVRFAE
ncbi:MAG: hypothetical protein UHX00_00860, partial [Caryophanon sp.]|nr:hypothetical protein [Caryophanon sp.]